jgi:hypothetical protein
VQVRQESVCMCAGRRRIAPAGLGVSVTVVLSTLRGALDR